MLTGPRVLLLVYTVAIEIVVWLALVPVTVLRLVRGRASWEELRERLACAPSPSKPADRGESPHVLVHAVSAGEMTAATALVRELVASGCVVTLTTGTAAGLATARRFAAAQRDVVACGYLPWDRWAIGRWLRTRAFDGVVVVETEIWPTLFLACRRQGISLCIANGRLRAADVRRYRWAAGFFAHVLSGVRWIGVPTPGHREAFVAIGAASDRVEVVGNLKHDATGQAAAVASSVAPDPRGRPLLVAGSTHDPEERWVCDGVSLRAQAGDPWRVVIAPRDVRRAASIAAEARARGWRAVCWSDRAHVQDAWDLLVLDTFGELAGCYAAADLVLIGGTLAPVGGHNLFEAAAEARPIMLGPHVDSIAELVAQCDAMGAVTRLSLDDPGRSMADACRDVRENPAAAAERGIRVAAICRASAGSAERHARQILAHLHASAR